MKQPEKHINVTSQKLVKQKFTREFCQCLHELFASRDENNEVPVILPKFINYLHLSKPKLNDKHFNRTTDD